MAIRTVVTRGYGNGTFNGTIPLVVTRGYTIGAALNLQIYTVSLDTNITPTISLDANITPAVDLDAQPTPAKELKIG